MKISVKYTINDGNIGEWNNNYQAAKALAKYCEERYESALRAVFGAEREIEVDINVARNTSGVSSLVVASHDIAAERQAEDIIEREGQRVFEDWSRSYEEQ